ncbi:MAG: hypothetical protein O2884_10530 [Chloroflexi bacterium]|nr:hypothetical protein [Chloroflexota bacterium]
MTSERFIAIATPTALLFALLAVVLPSSAGAQYARFALPISLVIGAGLAFWVGAFYRAGMRNAFWLLGGFLLLYGLSNWDWLLSSVAELLGANFLRALLIYQIVDYAMLLAATVWVVRMVDVRRLSRPGWLFAARTVVVAVAFVLNGMPTVRELFDLSSEAGTIYLVIRIFDVLVMTMLVPVVWLYVQNANSEYRENSTFMLVLVGIIASLTSAYLYEIVKGDPLTVIAASEYQQRSFRDVLYLFGYLIIAIGLFAHRKHQEWSFNRLDRLLLGDGS